MYSNSFNIEDILFVKEHHLNRSINEPTEHDILWLRALSRTIVGKIGCIIFENKDEEGDYLEVYLIDESLESGYARIIIAPNYILSYEQEQLLRYYSGKKVEEILIKNSYIEELTKKWMIMHPEIHLKEYSSIITMISHLYYTLNQKRCQEMLYKAGLEYIAGYVDWINNYNIIGTSPTMLLDGISMKVLRKLNTPYGIEVLAEYSHRIGIQKLYCEMPLAFKGVLNKWQCKYLRTVIDDINGGDRHYVKECISVLEGMKYVETEEDYLSYITYIFFRRDVIKHYSNLPLVLNLQFMIEEYEHKVKSIFCNIYERGIEIDNMFRHQYLQIGMKYEYHTKEYALRCPMTGIELVEASDRLNNCLWTYFERIMEGAGVVLLLYNRLIDELIGAIDIEVKENWIVDVKGKYNCDFDLESDKEIWDFLEEYKEVKGVTNE